MQVRIHSITRECHTNIQLGLKGGIRHLTGDAVCLSTIVSLDALGIRTFQKSLSGSFLANLEVIVSSHNLYDYKIEKLRSKTIRFVL